MTDADYVEQDALRISFRDQGDRYAQFLDDLDILSSFYCLSLLDDEAISHYREITGELDGRNRRRVTEVWLDAKQLESNEHTLLLYITRESPLEIVTVVGVASFLIQLYELVDRKRRERRARERQDEDLPLPLDEANMAVNEYFEDVLHASDLAEDAPQFTYRLAEATIRIEDMQMVRVGVRGGSH